MANLLKCTIGLDIAKDKYDACLAVVNETQKITIKASKSAIPNSAKGFDELIVWFKKHLPPGVPAFFCMEATGIYYEQIAWFLYQQGYFVSVLVPSKARLYMRSMGFKSKDDKIDAKGLAIMAIQQSLKKWAPLSHHLYELRQFTRFYQQLQETKTILRNQLHTLLHSRLDNSTVTNGLNRIIGEVEAQIQQANLSIEQALKKDPLMWKRVQNINTVKGLGMISIATVIAETDGFALFENQAQLVSYSGYDVVRNQSGKRQGGTRISKMGNNRIRRILFMPAFSVVKHKISPFAQLYDRVYKRTLIKMKAYVAVQRKLLIIIYTLWKKDEAFNPGIYPEVGTRLLSFH